MDSNETKRRGSMSPAAIERAERERRAIEMRRDGHTFDQIADVLGYANRGAAYKAVQRGLSRWMRDGDEDVRALELARTDVVISRLMPSIDRPDPDLKAVETVLRVMDYRARITGLYAPQRHQVGVEVRAQVNVRKLEAFEEWQETLTQAAAAHLTPPALPAAPLDADAGIDPAAPDTDGGDDDGTAG